MSRGIICTGENINGIDIAPNYNICANEISPNANFCIQCGGNVRLPGSVIQDALTRGSTVMNPYNSNAYQVLAPVGAGGFGIVYKAQSSYNYKAQSSYNLESYALKEGPQGSKTMESLPIQILGSLAHPNLVKFRDGFIGPDSRQYLVMDYVYGTSLEQVLAGTANGMSYEDVMKVAQQMCSVLSYLHSLSTPIIHRDIKPANIILEGSNISQGHSILVDLGIAKMGAAHMMTQTMARGFGSHGYAAPEQHSKGSGLFTDVYGLAATLYHLLTNTIPASSMDRLSAMVTNSPDPLEDISTYKKNIPQSMSYAIKKALELNIGKRYQNIGDFEDDLFHKRIHSSIPIPATQPTIKLPNQNAYTDQTVHLPTLNTPNMNWQGSPSNFYGIQNLLVENLPPALLYMVLSDAAEAGGNTARVFMKGNGVDRIRVKQSGDILSISGLENSNANTIQVNNQGSVVIDGDFKGGNIIVGNGRSVVSLGAGSKISGSVVVINGQVITAGNQSPKASNDKPEIIIQIEVPSSIRMQLLNSAFRAEIAGVHKGAGTISIVASEGVIEAESLQNLNATLGGSIELAVGNLQGQLRAVLSGASILESTGKFSDLDLVDITTSGASAVRIEGRVDAGRVTTSGVSKVIIDKATGYIETNPSGSSSIKIRNRR